MRGTETFTSSTSSLVVGLLDDAMTTLPRIRDLHCAFLAVLSCSCPNGALRRESPFGSEGERATRPLPPPQRRPPPPPPPRQPPLPIDRFFKCWRTTGPSRNQYEALIAFGSELDQDLPKIYPQPSPKVAKPQVTQIQKLPASRVRHETHPDSLRTDLGTRRRPDRREAA